MDENKEKPTCYTNPYAYDLERCSRCPYDTDCYALLSKTLEEE